MTQGPGHYNDADGNGTPNQAATGPNDPGDFASVQFNYGQLIRLRGLPDPPAVVVNGYNGQDYYPLPGKTFQFGHAFAVPPPFNGGPLQVDPRKGGVGTVITNMH